MRKNSLLYRMIALLLSAALLLNGCGGSGRLTKSRFVYQSGKLDEESYMFYTDDFFTHSAREYDPSLATASLSFALASFSSVEEEKYDHRYINGEELLTRLGFEDLEANRYYHEKPGMDSMGVFIARKDLADCTLLAVGTRGANYESEWASNLSIGYDDYGGYHQGFYEASEIILSALKDYVASRQLSGRLKIWTSGYSRSSAACNIACGRLNEYLRDGIAFLGTEVSLSREDIYAYCFEVPRGVSFDESRYPKSELFDNIFCIINMNDPVPMMVPEVLGFTRYGVEIILPDALNDPHFARDVQEVAYQYEHLRSFGDWGQYRLADFSMKKLGDGDKLISIGNDENYVGWTQGLYLSELLNLWAANGLKNREQYTERFQPGLRNLMRLAYASKNTSSSLKDLGVQLARELIMSNDLQVLTDDLVHRRDQLMDDLEPLLYQAMKRLNVEASTREIITTLKDLLGTFLEAISYRPGLFFTLLSLDNLKAFATAHYPELCLAHLRAMDPVYSQNPVRASLDGRYYQLTAPEDADIQVRLEGELVAQITHGVPLATASALAYGIHEGAAVVYLPAHTAYEVMVSGTEGVTLTLMDPGHLQETPQNISFSPAESGSRFTLPAD